MSVQVNYNDEIVRNKEGGFYSRFIGIDGLARSKFTGNVTISITTLSDLAFMVVFIAVKSRPGIRK